MAVFKGITPEQIESLCGELHAGVDEVGRGPLVGNVVTAAVILDPNNPITGLNDSKKLTEKKRELLFVEIHEKALSISVGHATPEEIDELNILHATMLAMQRAVAGLEIKPLSVLVDGNRTPVFHHGEQSGSPIPAHAVIKGDGLIAAISAASIIAKVIRDREMDLLDMEHPQYGFAKHKGYPTKAHFEALEQYGVLPEYRKSFKPVRERIERS
ncbi:ribonuclease HII [Shewanella hanedai]|jgi:ribonuclease HII|uniref:Ribonuclease HII n=1 Tax=Shewanella hanedai TaxID=25 RepID=A0A553JPD1_SHEHA|nr:ribonuclease HII [Shewanella hanedai]TRY14319.1 ribonuclease HII [Shewanella hanedai]GGI81084.1 ribonuclease HII [Shewanella hanedai]